MTVRRMIVLGIIGSLLCVIALFAVAAASKSYGRYQKRADAKNNVKVTAIQIQNQAQKVKVARQKAQIRFENAKGVREAQDEIAKTLTPMYVQFEMVEALKAIAASGRNSSVVFIPAGASGIPLMSTVDATKVGMPDSGK